MLYEVRTKFLYDIDESQASSDCDARMYVCVWAKHFTFYKQHITNIFNSDICNFTSESELLNRSTSVFFVLGE